MATYTRHAAVRRWMPPPADLARELDVHLRTVKRDFEALEYARVIERLDGEPRAVSLLFGGGLA
jgi:DNA-binding transcriptional regulator YhcF (GntR family)